MDIQNETEPQMKMGRTSSRTKQHQTGDIRYANLEYNEPHKQGINARNWEVRLMVQNNESKRKQEGMERQVGTCAREKEKIIDNRSDPNLIQTAKNLNHEGIRDVPQCKGAVEEIQGLNVDLEAFGALAKKLVFATGQRDKARGGCRPKAVWERASSKSDGTET
ncbi:hypothetical protein B0H11DRAFT_1908314 [Mycena galericulata]|nr:hypothetical protein B0H11DRAFT_1908314 [Mycena galericulata]